MNSKSSLSVVGVMALDESQPQPSEWVTTTGLRRAVFDDLLDRELLGFMLSSTHLRKYLAVLSTYASPKESEAFTRIVQNVDVSNEFHKALLKQFSAVYIAEAKIRERTVLLALLDAKFHAFAIQLPVCNVRYEASTEQLDSVEMAWKYRQACCKSL